MVARRKTDLEFVPALQLFGTNRKDSFLTVLAGANNSGKSLTLRWLKFALGRQAYFVGTNRFYHVYHFNSNARDPNEIENFESTFQSHFQDETHNHEQNVFDLNRIITGLKNTRRNLLFELCGQLIGNTFSMKKVEADNDLSPHYIDMDGQNLSVGSTGTRLLMTILGICMDDRFTTVLIDEPELGLSPKVQVALAKFFENREERKKYFPHLERVFLATHSQLFLARGDITNNYIVSKEGNRISLSKIETINEFHRLQFNLLGNAFESMFFPSAILVVEGKTDHSFVDRVIQLQFQGRRVTVIPSNGDVKKKIHGLREAFGEIDKSPFRSRLFVVLDSVHQLGLKDELLRMGVLDANVIIWSKNGIEYFYPPDVVATVFSCDISRLSELTISEDKVSLNGIVKTKVELASEVMKHLNGTSSYPEEFKTKLLSRIEQAIS